MNNDEHLILNIGRQLGSGGHIVAKILAERLQCPLYDRELLSLAAKESGYSPAFFEKTDEKKGFPSTLFHIRVPFIGDNSFYKSNLSHETLFQLQSDAIRKAAAAGPCVFVGRCADYVLRDHQNAINIFITADLNERVQRVQQRKSCTPAQARKLIEKIESRRAAYYNYYTGKQWGHSASYHLCVSTTALGIPATADYILDFIKRKGDFIRQRPD